MAYEYIYPGAYSPYTPSVTTPAYPIPSIQQRPYTSVYGPNSGMPQNAGIQTPQLFPPTAQQSNVPWIQVPNIEAARNVMVQPNQTAYMMNQNAPEFYVKATDQMGVATLKCFRFQEFDPTQEAAKEVLNSQTGNLVSREEFNNFAQAVSAQFNAIQQGMTQSASNSAPVAATPAHPAPPVAPVTPVEPTTKKKETAK